MPCPYLTNENNCSAKPYGKEDQPNQKILENYCNNELNMYDCRRAVIFEAYLKTQSK